MFRIHEMGTIGAKQAVISNCRSMSWSALNNNSHTEIMLYGRFHEDCTWKNSISPVDNYTKNRESQFSFQSEMNLKC